MANFFRLFLVLFIFMKNAGTGGNPWKHVTGLTNGFVDLIFPKSISQYLKEAQLKVIKKSGTFKIGDFKNKNLVGYSEFENRLEILGGGNGLRVKNLTLEDSTVYQAMITLQDSTLHTMFFNVTVYEPVPDPTLTTSCEKGKGNEHNVTIHCSVATNTKSLSFNWKYRHNGSDFQPINSTGDTIHMSLQPDYPNIEVQCIVQNPADSKSVTLMLGGDPLKHVTALTNGFVDLSFPTNIVQSVEEMQWKVTWGPETQKIADFKDNNLVVGYAPFKNRLKFLSGGIGLRITNPRLEDSGIYQFMITLENHVLRYESFNVTVYEPAPDPTITTSCEKGKGNEYNITIHCSVPANAISLSFTWKGKHNGLDFQPINATGDTIHMSLQPEYPNIEVQCIVQNPADSKSVTLMIGLCHSRNHWPIKTFILVVIALSICVICALLLPRQLPKSHVQDNKNEPDDNLKISIMETNTAISLETKYPKTEEKPFQVSENGVKYSKYDYIPVSAGKLDIAITESKAE